MSFLLDTNIVSELARRKPKSRRHCLGWKRCPINVISANDR